MVREPGGREDDEGAGTAASRLSHASIAVVDDSGLYLGGGAGFPAVMCADRFVSRIADGATEALRGVLILTSGVAVAESAVPGWMLVTDHVNWTGDNPLVALAANAPARRFLDVKGLYTGAVSSAVRVACSQAGIAVTEGVYVACPPDAGGRPETMEMARLLGGDAVGPGLVHAALAARFAGLEVAALCARMPAGAYPRGMALEGYPEEGFWRRLLAQLTAPERGSAVS